MPDPATSTNQQRKDGIERRLATMPPAARTVYLMSVVDGLSYQEIGRALRMSPRRVRRLLRDAIAHLDHDQ